MLRPFRLLEPTSLGEAAAELARLGEEAKVYAGGAELILLLRHGVVEANYLVNIKRIPGLDDITWDGGKLHVGATVRHRRVELDPLVRQHLPLLADAEAHVGNIRVRNQGTLGGNICFADPHSDPPTALLIYDSTVTVAKGDSKRQMPLDEFMVGTYEVALEPDEIMAEIEVEPLGDGWRQAWGRVERFYRPTANAAVAVKCKNSHIDEARLAVGCVGPRALRLPELEERLSGLNLDDAQRAITEYRPQLVEAMEPVDDLLGSAEYKIHIITVLLSRGLSQAVQGSGGQQHD